MISAMEIRWGSGWVGLISTFQSWSWGVKVRGADKTFSWKLGRQLERRIQPQATVPTVVACNSDRTNSTPSGVSSNSIGLLSPKARQEVFSHSAAIVSDSNTSAVRAKTLAMDINCPETSEL